MCTKWSGQNRRHRYFVATIQTDQSKSSIYILPSEFSHRWSFCKGLHLVLHGIHDLFVQHEEHLMPWKWKVNVQLVWVLNSLYNHSQTPLHPPIQIIHLPLPSPKAFFKLTFPSDQLSYNQGSTAKTNTDWITGSNTLRSNRSALNVSNGGPWNPKLTCFG